MIRATSSGRRVEHASHVNYEAVSYGSVSTLVTAIDRRRISNVVAQFVVATAILGGTGTWSNISVEPRKSAEQRDGSGTPLIPFLGLVAGPVRRTVPDGSVVRAIKEASGLSWEQLGWLFSVSRRTVHHWANGGRMTDLHARQLATLSRTISAYTMQDPDGARSALLAPDETGLSALDRIRRELESERTPVNPEPFTPAQLLGAE
jgi:hypothetical protein